MKKFGFGVNVNKENGSLIRFKFIKVWKVHRFRWFVDQSEHKYLNHLPISPAHPDFVNSDRSGQKKKSQNFQQHQEFPS